MLKRLALVAALALMAVPALPQANPRGEASATVAGKTVSIEYGRPSLKGRDMLAQARVGQAWRLGADAPTSLTTEVDLAFGDVKVPKGTYTLTATKVSADEWTLNVAGQNEEKVADIPLKPGRSEEPVETFTIRLNGDGDEGDVHLLWGHTTLAASFSGN